MEKKRTRWLIAIVITLAVRALDLVARYAPTLSSYLAEAWRTAFASDVDALRDADAAMHVAVLERKAATASLYAVAARAWRLLTGVRQAVRYPRPIDVARSRAFGVGTKGGARNVRALLAALDAAIEGATADPDGSAQLGVTSEIVAELRDVRAELIAADTKQERLTVAAREARVRRDDLHVRVENGLGKIIAVGRMVFVDNPAVAAVFAGLAPGARGRRATPAPQTEAGATGPAATEPLAAE